MDVLYWKSAIVYTKHGVEPRTFLYLRETRMCKVIFILCFLHYIDDQHSNCMSNGYVYLGHMIVCTSDDIYTSIYDLVFVLVKKWEETWCMHVVVPLPTLSGLEILLQVRTWIINVHCPCDGVGEIYLS